MTKEEFRNTTGACKDCVRLNKVQWELRLAQNVKGNKNSFYCYNSNERSNRENVSLLLNWAGDLVPADTDDTEGLNTSFVSVFTNKVSKASGV